MTATACPALSFYPPYLNRNDAMNAKLVFGLLATLGGLLLATNDASAAEPVDFARQIQPILAANCFKCHGPSKQESGLRLDSVAAAVQGGDSGPAIVPGKSGESLLIHAINGAEDASPMPPKEAGSPLAATQVALLTTWIDQGARAIEDVEALKKNVDHWSFKPRATPELPKVNQPTWVRNGIDAFVLANLEKHNLRPSPGADRATLIRRLHIDLLGLPPTPAQVDAFVKDTTAGAYDRLVDTLLASPHYGERWGRHWLDQARYADTDGYEKDRPRPDAWRYRDWVIDALNRDLPFDRFTIEQLAGDLLPDATPEQILATAFNRQTLTNTEGGADQEEFRVAAIVDRVNTTGAVWLGLTLGCAQCHSHKYDPISQREYYQFFAFYNNADETTTDVPISDEAVARYQEQKAKHDAQVAALTRSIDEVKARILPAQPAWEAELNQQLAAEAADPVKVHTLELTSLKSVTGAEFKPQADDIYVVLGPTGNDDEYLLDATIKPSGITALQLEFFSDKSLPKDGPGRDSSGTLALGEVRLTVTAPGSTESQPVKIARVTTEPADQAAAAKAIVDGNEKTGLILGPGQKLPRIHLHLAEPLTTEQAGSLRISLSQKVTKKQSIGCFRISAMTGKQFEIPSDVRTAIVVAPEKRSAKQAQAVAEFHFAQAPEAGEMRQKLAALAAAAPKTPTMNVRVVSQRKMQPRTTHILRRGDFLQPGQQVTPDTLSILPPLKIRNEGKPDRLDLAEWLISPENPLTSRVTVNRVWQQYFGRGLVNSSSDFGTQGEKPAHPELLDWLAGTWISQGWSFKSLHKLIVTSATYRQTSQVSPQLWQRDPYNVLLARQSRLRVEAEVIRDLSLAASGLMSPTVGGPSVRPRQPAGVSELTYANSAKWVESSGGDRYRRGMYTWFQRTSPYPMLMTFDAPESILSCTRRERSNTPLQALTLLNDPVFYECAQSLGSRILKETPAPESQSQLTEARLRYGLKLCVAREPSASELDALSTLYDAQLALCEAQPAAAAQLVGKAKLPDNVTAPQLAAWVIVGRTLLNLDEFITRE